MAVLLWGAAGHISMKKSLSAGLTASRGVEAAYLAYNGAAGPLHIPDGERGLDSWSCRNATWTCSARP